MRFRSGCALLIAILACLPVAALSAQSVSASAPRAPKLSRTDSIFIVLDSTRLRLDSLRGLGFMSRDSMQTMMVRAFSRRRVRIGVVVRGWPSETDSIGALIDAVTPGGPAATAGLLAGDIVIRFDGTPLAVPLTTVAPGTEVSSPGLRFAELVAKLAPDDTVVVEYRRGKIRNSARVVTAAEPAHVSVVMGPDGSFGFSGMPGAEQYWVGGGEGMNDRAMDMTLRRSEEARSARGNADFQYSFFMGGALRDLELAPVNPQLGSYFGTTEGVLVVDVPNPAPLNLKAGDVVLKVDGREVTSPRQLMRILGSYDSGESVRLEVMRQKKRVALTGSLGGQLGAVGEKR